MINQLEYNKIISDFVDFFEACEAYKNLLETNKLPMSIDVQKLELELRVRQFTELMKVSKSTEFKYKVSKTEQAKQQLVYENTTLEGDALMMDIQNSLFYLNTECRRFEARIKDRSINLEMLMNDYNFNPVEFLDNILINWNKQYNKEYKAAKAYVEAFNAFLGVVRDLDEYYDADKLSFLFKRNHNSSVTRCTGIEIDDVKLFAAIEGATQYKLRQQKKSRL